MLDADQSVRFERFLAGASLAALPVFHRGRVREPVGVGHTLNRAGGGGSSRRGDTEEDLAMAGCRGFVEALEFLPAAPIRRRGNGHTQGGASRDAGGASGRHPGESALVHRPSLGNEKGHNARDPQRLGLSDRRLRHGCFGGQSFANGFSGQREGGDWRQNLRSRTGVDFRCRYWTISS